MMKKKIFAALLVAGVLSPVFALGNIANASTKATLKPSVSYNSGKISFKGSASNATIKKVVVKRGSAKFTTGNVKNKKFTVSKTYSGKGTFYVYGASKAGKKLTKSYAIKSAQYVTAKPTYYSVDRSKANKTIVKVYVDNTKNVTFHAKFNGYDYTATAPSGQKVITFNYPADDYNLSIYATSKNKEASDSLIIPQVANGKGLTNPAILPF